MNKVTPYLYFVSAALLGALAIASVISVIQALTVRDTVTAIESALGTAVLALALAVFTHKLFKVGRDKLRAEATDHKPHD